jgi:hypothetical protein
MNSHESTHLENFYSCSRSGWQLLNTFLGSILFSDPPLPLFFLPSELSFAKCDAPGAQQTFNVMKQVFQYPSLANQRALQNQFRVCTSLQSKSWT